MSRYSFFTSTSSVGFTGTPLRRSTDNGTKREDVPAAMMIAFIERI